MDRIVVIESPFRGSDITERAFNQAYLQACVRDCVLRGESPYASHKMLPGALNEDVPEERKRGINAGYAFYRICEAVVFYVDLGWSPGMLLAKGKAVEAGVPVEERRLGGAWQEWTQRV